MRRLSESERTEIWDRYAMAQRVGGIGRDALNRLASRDATELDGSGPGRTRTCGQAIMSRLL